MEKLYLYNTLTRQKEEFKPIDPDRVRMYCCGPTVYNFAHVGNARAAVVFDVLNRLLRHVYGDSHVMYVRNITDVDDKIMESARSTGRPIEEITRHYEKIYNEDMAALGCLQPDEQPRCTEHIPHMIGMIEKLIEKGHAYENDGHVLFNVPSMPEYGQLSRKNRDELIAGARVEVAPYKKDASDFVLWKPSAPDQVGWDSPWGRGRPGWHIECSAMSEEHLGEQFDIHAGGLDLIFPHHENEIAQSRCAHDGKPMANYWLHNGFLNMGDEKMSKSLGNVVLAHDLLMKWPGEVIRLALLSARYRQPLAFTDDLLEQSKVKLDRLYEFLKAFKPLPVVKIEKNDPLYADYMKASEFIRKIQSEFDAAMKDDLNTPLATSLLFSFKDKFMSLPEDANGKIYSAIVSQAYSAVVKAASVLGILQVDPDVWFDQQRAVRELSEAQKALLEERLKARADKNWAESDRLRDVLLAEGIQVKDSRDGTEWTWVS